MPPLMFRRQTHLSLNKQKFAETAPQSCCRATELLRLGDEGLGDEGLGEGGV